MIVGTGIDIAEVDRIAASIERFGRRFLERVFTPDEIRYCESKANKAERYAGRFAAKEAAMKANRHWWYEWNKSLKQECRQTKDCWLPRGHQGQCQPARDEAPRG